MNSLLLIEDDAGLRNLYKELFGELYKLQIERDAQHALEYLSQNTPDLILTDLSLTDCKKFDILDKFKQLGILGKTSILVMSNFSEPEIVDTCMAYGIDGYIHKADIQLQDLLKIVSDALAKGHSIEPAKISA